MSQTPRGMVLHDVSNRIDCEYVFRFPELIYPDSFIHADTSFCRTGTCDCPSFVRQIYRPALCRNCFHTIAVHSQGEWKEDIEESTGRVYYVCVATGERLFARPGAVDLQTAVDRLYPNKRGTEPRTLADGTAAAPIVAKVVPEKIRAWTAFENAQALRSQAFAQRQNATASGPVDELLAFSEETAEYVPEEDQADLDGTLFVLLPSVLC